MHKAWFISVVVALSLLCGCFGNEEQINEESEDVIINVDFTEMWSLYGEYRMMSSPKAIDITNDGIKDIIVASGVEEQEVGKIMAIDGNNGQLIWEVNTNAEIYSTAQFEDLNNDNITDIIIGGRGHQLLAINGSSGDIIWQFDENQPQRERWFQFYTGQFIPDQDGDGVSDWLTANGGDPSKSTRDERESGYLMILSGASGNIISVADMPDGKETYMSPILYKPHFTQEMKILFGTGGETINGSLWSTNLSSILSGDISNATQLVAPSENFTKGILAPPSITDLNQDMYLDIIVSTFDGRVVAVDGKTETIMWSQEVNLYNEMGVVTMECETWNSPTLGFFTSLDSPDVFVHFISGKWPNYDSTYMAMIKGDTGDILWENSSQYILGSNPLAIDTNNDNIDEIIVMLSGFDGTHMYVLDTTNLNFSIAYEATNLSLSTPLITDIDDNGDLDMILSTTSWYGTNETSHVMVRLAMNSKIPENFSWTGYMGTYSDGHLWYD